MPRLANKGCVPSCGMRWQPHNNTRLSYSISKGGFPTLKPTKSKRTLRKDTPNCPQSRCDCLPHDPHPSGHYEGGFHVFPFTHQEKPFETCNKAPFSCTGPGPCLKNRILSLPLLAPSPRIPEIELADLACSRWPRRCRVLTPSTKLMASMRFDFPAPFGPK